MINEWLAGLLSSAALIENEDNGDADDFKRARMEERGDVEESLVGPDRVSSARCRRRRSGCVGNSSELVFSWKSIS